MTEKKVPNLNDLLNMFCDKNLTKLPALTVDRERNNGIGSKRDKENAYSEINFDLVCTKKMLHQEVWIIFIRRKKTYVCPSYL